MISKELSEQIEREAEACYGSPLSCDQGYIMGATTYAALLQDSERRRNEANALLFPLLDYGQSKEANIPLGASITAVILQLAKLFEEAKKVLEEIENLTHNQPIGMARKIAREALGNWKEEGEEGEMAFAEYLTGQYYKDSCGEWTDKKGKRAFTLDQIHDLYQQSLTNKQPGLTS